MKRSIVINLRVEVDTEVIDSLPEELSTMTEAEINAEIGRLRERLVWLQILQEQKSVIFQKLSKPHFTRLTESERCKNCGARVWVLYNYKPWCEECNNRDNMNDVDSILGI